jgi:hypothetical protein
MSRKTCSTRWKEPSTTSAEMATAATGTEALGRIVFTDQLGRAVRRDGTRIGKVDDLIVVLGETIPTLLRYACASEAGVVVGCRGRPSLRSQKRS